MNEHRDEIEAGFRFAFDPEPFEIFEALTDFFTLLSARLDQSAGLWNRGDDVRPAGELVSIFQREVEQCGQQQSRQLYGDMLDPVEGLALGEVFEHRNGSLSDLVVEVAQAAGGGDAPDGFTFDRLVWRVHGDEGSHVAD
jgi:hypothetical protein